MSLPTWLTDTAERVRHDLEHQRLPHALILVGQPGDGVHRLGRHLAAIMLCERRAPCGECKACRLSQSGTHPDQRVIEPEGKSETIKVAQIRDIGGFIHETPQQGGNKVVRLVAAERMNVNAANALLKTLEEPHQNTYLILETPSLSRLLPTVRSRCRIYKLPRPTRAQSEAYLSDAGIDANEHDQRLAMADQAPLAAAELDTERLQRWQQQIDAFRKTGHFHELAAFVGRQPPELLLRQLLLWVDGALRMQHQVDVTLPGADHDMASALRKVPGGSLFGFRDYILELLDSLQRQANLNQQMWSEQLAARWLELHV